MVTVKNAEVDSFGETEEIKRLPGARKVTAYQKAMAKTLITEEDMSEEMKALGGFTRFFFGKRVWFRQRRCAGGRWMAGQRSDCHIG